jgi:hypothetical protein
MATKREFDAETKRVSKGMSASQYRRQDRKHVPAWVKDALAEREPGRIGRAAMLRAGLDPDHPGTRLQGRPVRGQSEEAARAYWQAVHGRQVFAWPSMMPAMPPGTREG